MAPEETVDFKHVVIFSISGTLAQHAREQGVPSQSPDRFALYFDHDSLDSLLCPLTHFRCRSLARHFRESCLFYDVNDVILFMGYMCSLEICLR